MTGYRSQNHIAMRTSAIAGPTTAMAKSQRLSGLPIPSFLLVRTRGGPTQNIQPASLHRGVLAPGGDGDEHTTHNFIKPEPVFFSIRRARPIQGRALDLDTHDPVSPRSLPDVSNVSGVELRMLKRNLIASQLRAEAKEWADELTLLEMRHPTENVDDVWRRLATQTGIPFGTFWTLRYKFDSIKDIWGSTHRALELAVRFKRDLAARRAQHNDDIKSIRRSARRT